MADFPDIADHNVDSPVALVSPAVITALYRQEHNLETGVGDPDYDTIKSWMAKEAESRGWKSVAWTGKQCVLSIATNVKITSEVSKQAGRGCKRPAV